MTNKLSEEDTKRIYITPSLYDAGWNDDQMFMEYYINEGRIYTGLNGEHKRLEKTKEFIDYLLTYQSDKNLAIVEAKTIYKTPEEGLLQAEGYARKMGVPFAYSTNGQLFYESDLITHQTRYFNMDEFPSPKDLWQRYITENNYDNEQMKLINTEKYYNENYKSRYYQTATIDKTIEAIAKGQKRCLIVLATGTGKTYVASQIVWKLKQGKKVNKVLYLADRNVLINNPYNHEFSVFGSKRVIIKHHIDNSHEIYFGLYQMLRTNSEEIDENGESNLDMYKKVSPDFFDLIIVDECHRGSVRQDSKWREILEYFSSAIQIGMTATPKVIVNKSVKDMDEDVEEDDNIAFSYFGNPIYEYSLQEGINDGFLAPFKVISPIVSVDNDGYTPKEGELDIYGRPLEHRTYTRNEFDKKLIIDSRTKEVAEIITDYLKSTDRYQKTIIFCCNNNHAERLRIELSNLNSEIITENPNYVVRITNDARNAYTNLDTFMKPYTDNRKTDPFIVTTSELLTTGVDAITTKLIVLDKIVNSPTQLKQMIGRGTRISPSYGKYDFTIIDFRNATSLMSDDTKWLGTFETKEIHSRAELKDYLTDYDKSENVDERKEQIVYHIKGDRVSLVGQEVKIMSLEGKVRTESLVDYSRENILAKYGTLDDFVNNWSIKAKHSAIVKELENDGVLLEDLKRELKIPDDMDDFDVICYVAYHIKPLTRSERVNKVKKSKIYDKYTIEAKKIIDILLDKYSDGAIDDLNDVQLLYLKDFQDLGLPRTIMDNYFGGPTKYKKIIEEIDKGLYEA